MCEDKWFRADDIGLPWGSYLLNGVSFVNVTQTVIEVYIQAANSESINVWLVTYTSSLEEKALTQNVSPTGPPLVTLVAHYPSLK